MHAQPQEALRLCERVFAAAWQMREPLAHVLAAERYGLIMDHLGRAIEARNALFDALQAAQSAHLFAGEARLLEQIARGYYTEGQYRQAIQYWAHCAEVSEQSGREVKTWISAKVGLGQIYYALGDFESAVALHLEALGRVDEVGDPYLETKVKINLGVDLMSLQRREEAAEVFIPTLDLCLMHQYSDYAAEVSFRLGQIQLESGQLDHAMAFLDAALGHARDVDYRWGEANILACQAEVLARRGQHAAALQTVRRAQVIAAADSFSHMLHQQHFAAARYAEAMGDVATALTELKLAHHGERNLMAASVPERNKELEDKAGLRPSANRMLVELSNDVLIEEGTPEQAFTLITSESCRILEVERASVWLLDSEVHQLRCASLGLKSKREGREAAIAREVCPAFFDWLESDPKPLIAHDAEHHPYSWELAHSYLRSHGIRSILAFAIRVSGQARGILLLEVAGPQRNWTPDEVMKGQQLADIATRAVASSERRLFQQQIGALNTELIQANEALEARVRDRTAALEKRNDELLALNETIRVMATIDELTGIYNRRHIVERLRQEEARSERDSHPFCVCLIDIDYFKDVNDRHGHQAGDEVLRIVAQTAREVIRETDCVGRYGGEEFLLLLAGTDLEGARVTAERLRTATEALVFAQIGADFRVTISLGLAGHYPGEHIELTISRADAALYRAKAAGRNRVVH
ncbi:diguanylate cyclase [Chitinolyticbacter albus]|uniref:diguanylate cyclase n=1 Tax=Chitinolyticbacter albus TaxID=2961951 RepID=UPI00210ADD37|nr:diguanylate cyclase [Chitinolyticbacter albus]